MAFQALSSTSLPGMVVWRLPHGILQKKSRSRTNLFTETSQTCCGLANEVCPEFSKWHLSPCILILLLPYPGFARLTKHERFLTTHPHKIRWLSRNSPCARQHCASFRQRTLISLRLETTLAMNNCKRQASQDVFIPTGHLHVRTSDAGVQRHLKE